MFTMDIWTRFLHFFLDEKQMTIFSVSVGFDARMNKKFYLFAF